MSSFDKIVKLACKPKAAAPKAKYIDPIIAATWSDDGAVSDVCKALVPRVREPNAVIVFKALIVLHTMVRNGSTDNVLGYLSQTDILRLRNVTAANWEGYAAPENVANYALYLDSRIRAYRDLKHDAIRVQSDTNRDVRNSISTTDTDTSRSRRQQRPPKDDTPSGPTRSKTMIGRKLRSMTVEKGLLRETRIVHNMIDTLVECRFYLDDLEDELNIEALRMLVKDLLILFQAGNEGVINLLEHYFEMSHVDAKEALGLYRNFCTQTEKVVEYLGVARKLQNLLNVPIPNLKHAPVSLAGALQEYLDDPNFEDNRLEYKENKKATESSGKTNGTKNKKSSSVTFKDSAGPSLSASTSSASTNGGTSSSSRQVVDFFSAIEEEQQNMFTPPHSAPIVQQPTANPFSQMQQFGQAPQIAVQPTGFMVPQHTAFQASPAPNPFNGMLGAQLQQPQQQAPGHQPFSAYLPAQATGFQQPQATGLFQQPQQQQPQQTGFQQQPQQPQQPGLFQQQQPQQTGFQQQQQQPSFLRPQQSNFLQPQTTGANPFRQSMLVPQTTGMALFSNTSPSPNGTNASATLGQNLFIQQPASISAPNSASPFTASNSFSAFTTPQPSKSAAAFTSSFGGNPSSLSPSVPNRPQSTPLTNNTPTVQAVKTHPTGTRNPFGPVITPAPPVPKVPTLMELAMGIQTNGSDSPNPPQNQPSQSTPPTNQTSSSSGFNFANSALNPGPADISSIASSFTGVGNNNFKANNAANSSSSTSPNSLEPQHTAMPFSHFSSSLSNNTTGAAFANPSSFSPSISVSAPLKSQATGFSGLKPFKPSSSFGAAMMDSLPPVSPSLATPQPSNVQPQHTATPASTLSSFTSNLSNSGNPTTVSRGALNSQQTGGQNSIPNGSSFGSSNFSSSLNSQPTGASGPFGMSNFSSTPTGSSLGVGLRPQLTGGGAANPFRASMMTTGSSPPQVPSLPLTFNAGQPFSSSFASSFNFNAGQQQQQQQHQPQQQNATPASLF